MRYTLAFLALLAACSNATAPKAGDPILLIRNQDPGQTVIFTWRDGQGIVGGDTIRTTGTFCERFTARPDSAYYEFVRADSTNGWYAYQSNYFDPATRPAWTVDIMFSTSHIILPRDTTAAPC